MRTRAPHGHERERERKRTRHQLIMFLLLLDHSLAAGSFVISTLALGEWLLAGHGESWLTAALPMWIILTAAVS